MGHLSKKFRGMLNINGDFVIVECYAAEKKINSYQLPLYTAVVNHSPNGFAWGYSGSGPSQLALAILIEHFSMQLDSAGARKAALRQYMDFKFRCIAKLDQYANFVLTTEDVARFL